MKPLRVAAITSGKNAPSTRFRVHQLIDSLESRDLRVTVLDPSLSKYAGLPEAWQRYLPKSALTLPGKSLQLAKLLSRIPALAASRRCGVTWLQRELLPGRKTLECLIRPPYVFDVDDAIWTSPGARAAEIGAIARSAACVIAGNDYLADWFRPHARRLVVIPTAVDVHRFRPAPRRRDGRFLVGWTGIKRNLPALMMVLPALREFLARHPESVLRVISDECPEVVLPPRQFEFVPWRPEIEAYAVSSLDAGLMPLLDDEMSRGKCAFKMLQYMACGVPSVVSPVGMNGLLIRSRGAALPAVTPREWVDALEEIFANGDLRGRLAVAGRQLVSADYSIEAVAPRVAEVMHSVSALTLGPPSGSESESRHAHS